jgi:hypothetical protein
MIYVVLGCILLIPAILLIIGICSITDEDWKKANAGKPTKEPHFSSFPLSLWNKK